MAGPIPGERTGAGPGARDRVQGRGGDRVHPRCRERQLQLDGAGAHPQDRGRQDQARLLGLSSQQLATAVNTVLSGITATQVRSGIYLVDVLVRASADQRMSLSTIRAMQVPLPSGKSVPLTRSRLSITAKNIPFSGAGTGFPQ